MGLAASHYYLGNFSEMRPLLEEANDFNEKYLDGDLDKFIQASLKMGL